MRECLDRVHAGSTQDSSPVPPSSAEIPARGDSYLEHLALDIAKTFGALASACLDEPGTLIRAQMRLLVDYAELFKSFVHRACDATTEPVILPDPKDRRFRDPLWSEEPVFDFIKQTYLITTRSTERFIQELRTVDNPTRHKARFYVQQISAALSPSNFPLTNPDVLRAAWESGGMSFSRGMRMFIEDAPSMNKGLIIRQTDRTAFRVGDNLAITPGKVIYQNSVMQLIQYEAATPTVLKRPLLIAPPWINKFYILDLDPEQSFAKWCIDRGHSVFMISWVNPDATLADKSFSDYGCEGIVEAVEVIERVTGEHGVNALGYCIGGTLLAATSAYMQSQGDQRIRSATLLATQVDFTHAGDLKIFINKDLLHVLEADMKVHGFLNGYKMNTIFNILRPNDLVWPYMINTYLKGEDPVPFDLMFWNSDTMHIPASNHAFYLRECYLKNSLAEGKMSFHGVPIDLSKLRIPIYSLATVNDHIAPPESVFFGNKCFGGNVDYVLTGAGHVAGIVNPPLRNRYCYWRSNNSGNHESPHTSYEDWRAHTEKYEGSWWTDWDRWIKEQDSSHVPSRAIGSATIEDAPGSYVKRQCSL